MKSERKLIICGCGQPEHQFQIVKLPDEPELYLEVHLTKRPFLERLKYAAKYVFGYQSKYGAFDEVVIEQDEQNEILDFLDKIHRDHSLNQMVSMDEELGLLKE